MKNIIIVGNGSSLLDKENGSKIDSFDIVVRFNGFKINGFEKHTGTKTNIWYTVNMHHVRKINEFDRIIVHTWHWGVDDKIYQTLKASTNRPCTKTTREMVREIPLRSPSTGLIAIHHLLKEHNKLTITGFDWWDREKHHYGDGERRGGLHKPKEEYAIIQDFIKLGKVSFL